jgi:hypothetical protein
MIVYFQEAEAMLMVLSGNLFIRHDGSNLHIEHKDNHRVRITVFTTKEGGITVTAHHDQQSVSIEDTHAGFSELRAKPQEP